MAKKPKATPFKPMAPKPMNAPKAGKMKPAGVKPNKRNKSV